MRITLDLNVILDVVQNRAPHYTNSAQVLSRVRTSDLQGILPGHALTTIYYIINKSSGLQKAQETIDWLLHYFEIAAADKLVFRRARTYSLQDFEDAVVAACAEANESDFIVTRNTEDFVGSAIKAITPDDLLQLLRKTTAQ